jgi:error-prone DNA polymerase
MGHKRSRERMADICQKMMRGMDANGIAPDIAQAHLQPDQRLRRLRLSREPRGELRADRVREAYLRHYYAPEFLCAILNAQPMGFYAPGTLIEDAKRHGVEVRPVDVTRSRWDHTLEPGPGRQGAPAVRLGIRAVLGLGGNARARIEAALTTPPDAGATPGNSPHPFTSITDFVQRTTLDRRALRALAEAGAFDAFVADEPPARRRRVALWRVLEAERDGPGPLALFPESQVPPHLPAFAPPELTEADYRLTGLSLNGHPMRHVRALLAPNGVRTAREILAMRDGEPVAHAGLVICRQRPGTAKGFVFLTLEDETGTINVVVTPQRFERQALLISRTPLLLVRGVLQVESGVHNIRAKSFAPLKAGAGEDAVRGHNYR